MNNIDIENKIKPKFSIIMPTYNRAFCIKNAVNSLLNQTYQDFELIIIDDGSTDDTEKNIRNNFAKEIECGKIFYKKIEKNVGVSRARNLALGLAKNPWICYLDTDNIILPSFLEEFAGAILENPYTKTFYACFKNTENGLIVGQDFDFNFLCIENYIDLGVFCHHKSLPDECGGFDVHLKRLVDWDLIIRYTRKCPPYLINKVLMEYSNGADFARISNTEDFEAARKYVLRKARRMNACFKEKLLSYKNLPYINGEWRRYIWLLGLEFSIRNKQKEIQENIKKDIKRLEKSFKTFKVEAIEEIKNLQNRVSELETLNSKEQNTPPV